MEENGIHIALAAERIGEFFGIPVTNTLLMGWIVVLLLAAIAFFAGRRATLVPGKIQTLFEMGFSYVLSYMTETLENRRLAERFFPLIVSIFLFIFAANIVQFFPGVGSIGYFHTGEHGEVFAPLLRSLNTDLNVTLALTVVSFFVIEAAGVATLGLLKYAGKFVNFKSPLSFAVGIMELFSEVARLVSFSFRLFGNIFAGEVMILVIAFFVPVIFPVPLILFELFVGFLQGVIFALLTLFFIKVAIAEPHEEHA